MLRCFALLLAFELSGCSPANSQPLPIPSAPILEHPYPPTSRTVHLLYTCMDGARSVTLQHGQHGRGEITSLTRNGNFAPQEVIEQIKTILKRLDHVSSISAECGKNQDYLFVNGMIGRSQSGVLIDWSVTEAKFLQVL